MTTTSDCADTGVTPSHSTNDLQDKREAMVRDDDLRNMAEEWGDTWAPLMAGMTERPGIADRDFARADED